MLLRLSADLDDELRAFAAASDEPVSVVTRRALDAGLHVLHAQRGLRSVPLRAA